MNTITATTNQNGKRQRQRQLPSDMINLITTYIPKPSYKDYEKYILLFHELHNEIEEFKDYFCEYGNQYYYDDEFEEQTFISEFENIFSLMEESEFHGKDFIVKMFFDDKIFDRLHYFLGMFDYMIKYFQEEDNIINIMYSYLLFKGEFNKNNASIYNRCYVYADDYNDRIIYTKISNIFKLKNSLFDKELFTKKRQIILEIKIRHIKNNFNK